MEKMVIELITFLQKWGLWQDVTILADGKVYFPALLEPGEINHLQSN